MIPRYDGLGVVDVPTVANGDDDNHQYVVLYEVDDAVIAYPDPVSVPPAQLPRCRWAWVLGEKFYRSAEAGLVTGMDLA